MFEKLKMSPWIQMWIAPRETIRSIVTHSMKQGYIALSTLYGFPIFLQIAQNLSLGDRFSVVAIVVASALLAPLLGFLFFPLSAALLYWTGKWIGGTGSYLELRTAVAWAHVPNTVNVLTFLIMIAKFGHRFFLRKFPDTAFVGNELKLLVALFFIQLVLTVWGIVIGLKAIGEVQRFSAWKALLNVLIPFFMILIGWWIVMTLGYMIFAK